MLSTSVLLLIAGLCFENVAIVAAQQDFEPQTMRRPFMPPMNHGGFADQRMPIHQDGLGDQRIAHRPSFLVFDPPNLTIDDYAVGGAVKVRLSDRPMRKTTLYYEAPSLAFTACSLDFDHDNWNEWQEIKTVAMPYMTRSDTLREFKMKFTASCPGTRQHGQVMDYDITRGAGTGAKCTATGDPHYHTFDGRNYDFMGIGCFQLVKAGFLTIQTVTTQWGNTAASVNKSVAIRFGKAVWIIDAVSGKSCDEGGDDISNVKLTESNNSRDFHFKFPEGTEVTVTIKDGNPKYLDVNVLASGHLHGRTRGLCGNFDRNNNNEFIGPNGETFPDATSFGHAWKCPDHDNLFQCGSHCEGANDYLKEPCNECKVPTNLLGSGVFRDIPVGYRPSHQWPTYRPVAMPTIRELPPIPICPDNFLVEAEHKCKQALAIPGAGNLVRISTYIDNCIRDAKLTCSLAFVDGLKSSCMNELGIVAKTMEYDVDEPGKVRVGHSLGRVLGLNNSRCPRNCSAHGQCLSCGCKCAPGYTGVACEIYLGESYNGVRPIGFAPRQDRFRNPGMNNQLGNPGMNNQFRNPGMNNQFRNPGMNNQFRNPRMNQFNDQFE